MVVPYKHEDYCSTQALEYNKPELLQNVIASTNYAEYPCLTTLGDVGNVPLEFRIDRSDAFTDLGQIFLKLSVKVEKKNGSALTVKDTVAPINAWGYSLFSGVDCYINDRLISKQQSGLYPYLTYVRLLLYTTPNEKKTLLKQVVWEKDDAGMMEKIGKDSAGAKNEGFVRRNAVIQNSKEVDLVVRVLYDFALQQLIPSQTEIFLRFHRSEASFCLMSESDDYQVNITKARLLVPRVQVTREGSQHVNALAHSHGLCLSGMRSEVFTRLVGKNDQNCDWQVMSGLLPRRLYIFQTRNASYNGTPKYNPFNFDAFGLKRIQVYANDQCIPLAQGIDVSSDAGALLYALTMKAINRADNTSFEQEDYRNGYMIAAADLTPDYSGWGLYSAPPQFGSLRIVLDYDKTLTEAINVFCLVEYDATLHMDEHRNFNWLH